MYSLNLCPVLILSLWFVFCFLNIIIIFVFFAFNIVFLSQVFLLFVVFKMKTRVDDNKISQLRQESTITKKNPTIVFDIIIFVFIRIRKNFYEGDFILMKSWKNIYKFLKKSK